MRQWITRPPVTAVPPPQSAHVDSAATDQTRKRARAWLYPSFEDAALPRRVILTDKTALRARVRAARDAFAATHPAAIIPPPQFLALLAPGLTVTSYVPLGSEADPSPLARAAVEAGCVIALPHVTTRAEPMRFLIWETSTALVSNSLGLQQPHHDATALAPDIILTPLLAFDAKLDRLGQGAGYYDRAFAQFSDARRIGVAWSVQQVEALPTDAWDMPLHAIITECGWITRP